MLADRLWSVHLHRHWVADRSDGAQKRRHIGLRTPISESLDFLDPKYVNRVPQATRNSGTSNGVKSGPKCCSTCMCEEVKKPSCKTHRYPQFPCQRCGTGLIHRPGTHHTSGAMSPVKQPGIAFEPQIRGFLKSSATSYSLEETYQTTFLSLPR